MKYTKVRFTSKLNGNTAGLVLTDHQQESMTITQVSKLFPISESMKMERLEDAVELLNSIAGLCTIDQVNQAKSIVELELNI